MNHHFAPARRPLGARLALVAALGAVAASVLGAPNAAAASPDFLYTFNSPGTLRETGSMAESWSPYFYLNSGAYLVIENGVGATVHGALDALDPFRLLYLAANPLDTENGFYPQNLFRLVTKGSWESSAVSLSFIINRHTLTDTPNRDGYSGVLLFSRYLDGDNLYYAGVRDDGKAVIKKKIGGAYHTLASVQIFGVAGKYDREKVPSLLPQEAWTGLRFETRNRPDGSVYLRLLLDRENDGSFISILSAVDSEVGDAPILSGHSGVRTDYLEARFENFRVKNL